MSVSYPWHMPRASVFVAVHQEGSISAAGRRLGLTKSVVSNHLKQLEEALGVRLVERSTRQLRLTDAGTQFLPYALRMLEAWSAGLDALQASLEVPTGRLSIAAPSLLAHVVLPQAMAAFRRRYPQVVLDLRLSDDLTDLIAEEVDVALRAGPLASSELVARKVADDVHVLVCAPEMLAQGTPPSDPEGLVDWPWISHSALGSGCTLAGPNDSVVEVTAKATTCVDSASGLIGLCEAGLGVALIPLVLAREALHRRRLVRLLPGWFGPAVPIFAVYPSREFLSPKVSRFIEVLQDHMQLLPE